MYYEQKWFQKLTFDDLSLKFKISGYHFLDFFLLLYFNSDAILTKKSVFYIFHIPFCFPEPKKPDLRCPTHHYYSLLPTTDVTPPRRGPTIPHASQETTNVKAIYH